MLIGQNSISAPVCPELDSGDKVNDNYDTSDYQLQCNHISAGHFHKRNLSACLLVRKLVICSFHGVLESGEQRGLLKREAHKYA